MQDKTMAGISPLRRKLRSIRPGRVASVGILLLIVVAAVMAPILTSTDPLMQDISSRLRPPGTPGHPLGTDILGRDVLARLIHGARYPLMLGLSAVAIGGFVGGVIGIISGYFGRRVDAVLMRLVDIQLSVPGILLALTIVAVVGTNFTWLTLILAFGVWPVCARVVRSEVLVIRRFDYIVAARLMGAKHLYVLVRHVVDHVIGTFTVITTLQIGRTVLLGAALSFLGLGVQEPAPDWGLMMAGGQQFIATAWWLVVIPGIALILLVISLNVIGDWVRDTYNGSVGSRREIARVASANGFRADAALVRRSRDGESAQGAGRRGVSVVSDRA